MNEGSTKNPYATRADIETLRSIGAFPGIAAQMYRDMMDRTQREIEQMLLGAKPASPPDPRIAREAQRREIDAILHDDARRFPAFATARRCAVMAIFEGAPPVPPSEKVRPSQAETVIAICHSYERERGGQREPSEASRGRHGRLLELYARGIDAYERARALP
jgi:hypothetical protein